MKFIIDRASHGDLCVNESFKSDSGNCSFINIDSMEDLKCFVEKYGDIIISEPLTEKCIEGAGKKTGEWIMTCDERLEFFSITIYDSYVE